jgi:hypothetical protein
MLLVAWPAFAVGGFSPSLFEFKTVIKDDGKDEAGGWQEVSTKLRFVDTRYLVARMWTCSVKVGVPLRTSAKGQISPGDAAIVTAEIATDASADVMHRKEEWLTGEFCIEFREEMKKLFFKRYSNLGAKVNAP